MKQIPARALRRIVRALDQADHPLLRRGELGEIFSDARVEGFSTEKITRQLVSKQLLHEITVISDRRNRIFYAWRSPPSPFVLASALRPGGYLSHGAALPLHGIGAIPPCDLYINKEQSTKPRPTTPLAQEAIDRAFASPQRASKSVFFHGEQTYTLIEGKDTNELGVVTFPDPGSGRTLRVTDLERTLIDVTVRPKYAGGVHAVATVFQAARPTVNVERLLGYLEQLDYVYPYHQAIGFYLARAGHPRAHLFRASGLHHNFYLDYQMAEPSLDAHWRVFVPRGLAEPRSAPEGKP